MKKLNNETNEFVILIFKYASTIQPNSRMTEKIPFKLCITQHQKYITNKPSWERKSGKKLGFFFFFLIAKLNTYSIGLEPTTSPSSRT